MDTVISIATGMLPHTWQLVVGFLLGCWWYRRTLKNNPERLQTLVTLVNSTGKYAESAFSAVTDVAAAVSPKKVDARTKADLALDQETREHEKD